MKKSDIVCYLAIPVLLALTAASYALGVWLDWATR